MDLGFKKRSNTQSLRERKREKKRKRQRQKTERERERERERGSRYGNVAAAPCISLSEAVFIGRLQGTPASVLP